MVAIFRRTKRLDKFFGLLRRDGGPAQEPVHRHERGDFLRRPAVNAADDGRAHAVTDERGLVHTRVAHHGQHCLRKVVHGIIASRLVALAMTGKIDEDEPRATGQRRHLLAPETAVARPAMDEKDGATAFAFDNVVDLVRAERDEAGFAGVGRVLRTRPADEQQNSQSR